MTDVYTSMTARFPRCHGNSISHNQISVRPLSYKNPETMHFLIKTCKSAGFCG